MLVAAVASLGFGNGVVFQIVSSCYPERMRTASGLIGAAGCLGGFLFLTVVGLLKEVTGTVQSGFFTFAALTLLA